MDTKLDHGYINRKRSILRRRTSLSSNIQALVDGVVILLLCYSIPVLIKDVFTLGQLVATVILLIIMGVVYDRFGVYRSSAGLIAKTIVIGKAWTISFGSMLILAWLAGYTLSGSRLVVVSIFTSGLAAQLTIQFVFQLLHRIIFKTKSHERALIVGTGPLSDYLYERIDKNPWINENVVGAVTAFHASGAGTSEVPLLGTLDDVNQLVEEKDINTVYLIIPLDGSPFIEKLYFDLLDRNVNIHWVPNIFALNLINHNVKELAGIPVLTLSESPLTGSAAIMKGINEGYRRQGGDVSGAYIGQPYHAAHSCISKNRVTGTGFLSAGAYRLGWKGVQDLEISQYANTHHGERGGQASSDERSQDYPNRPVHSSNEHR